MTSHNKCTLFACPFGWPLQGLTVYPVIQFPAESVPSDVNNMLVLPPCILADDLPAGSSVGNCLGYVPAAYFPGPGGSSSASVVLQAYVG